MKRILVTGSNGLLGQTLTRMITVSARAELIATSKGENRYSSEGGYVYAEMDICNHEQTRITIERYAPDAIIHTAAITNVDVCHVRRKLCQQVNVEAVRNLVSICEEKNIHFVHLSTDFVFDGLAGPYSEDDQPNPVSFYGQSKFEAEKLVMEATCSWSIIRTILVYGVTANMSRSNIVLWVKGALDKGERIKVVDDQVRMPTLVDDLAEACFLVVEKQAGGVFHISGKDTMTVAGLAEQVAVFWHLDKSLITPVSSASLNQEARRPLRTGFKLDKAHKVLGYNPHSFEEGLSVVEQQLSQLKAANL